MAYTIRGKVGELRWGYRKVATLGSWTLEGGALVATVTDINDTFGVSQSPLKFVTGNFSRPLDGLQITGWTLTASIRPQENADVPSPVCPA
jgi:hypothetical protein